MTPFELSPEAKRFNFELAIARFNSFYGLPLASYPTVEAEAIYQQRVCDAPYYVAEECLSKRLNDFLQIIRKEIEEGDDIKTNLNSGIYEGPVEFLVDMADWLCDIIVYCTSEAARLGLPVKDILKIIMESNMSKADIDGKPIIRDGKVQKGPNYWKPEPKIRALLEELIKEHTNAKAP